ncbi:proteoglycan 4 isoform X2 [Lucilia sericata]|uniref:proteoglycan 4 isoform X2 n=1 Tax=Lucilia sericata TaxID=13632 RepID=UPI0018A87AA8|nr:proteoglycan 4 isoform X2 [Lucilia sericata]
MDPRKQKRLGPAPIASFEKSFEDTTSLTTSSVHAAGATTTTTAAVETTTASLSYSVNINLGHVPAGLQEVAKTLNGNNVDVEGEEEMNKEMMDINDKGITATTTTCKKTITTKSATTPTAMGDATNITRNINNTTGTVKRAPPLKATANRDNSTGSTNAGGVMGVGDLTASFKGASTLCTPSTPRIELSRASSSSHHEEDSRDSSPENVFEQVGTGTLQETLDMGFREEGALELRSSTEELYFMDPTQKKEEEAKMQQQQLQQQQSKRASPHMFKMDEHQSYLQQHQRKDSASSEVAALLCISGRTSRISSVGSQGSAVSRLSAVSGVSRSPSPHRMLLETSFCGPKPVESIVDGSVGAVVEAPTAALLEQVLLARTRDPTQAILAEGIKVESSPKKKPPTSLTNGDAKLTAKIKAQNRPETGVLPKTTMGAQRKSTKSPGQMIVGKTPSGTEYIRINLKPDFMYDDKGIASNEKVVEAANAQQQAMYGSTTRNQNKPASLSLTQKSRGENLLTPTASPKPTRKGEGSRSPSPATVSVSRKSSFSSLFRFGAAGKDSPDSPRERSRPRSKSKERGQTPQSQNATPNKQKSVLAIFKPGKRGSSAGAEGSKTSKTSSPTDAHEMQQLQSRSKSHTPVVTATGSRPNSRLKYYEDPVEGYIHIPLHTPPEEKETRKLLQSIQQLNAEPVRPQATAITMSDLESAVKKLKPVGARKNSGSETTNNVAQRGAAFPLKRIENLDAIHTLPQEDNKERTWSLEVNRHSSQDSQETVGSGESYVSAIKVATQRSSHLAEVKEHVVTENGIEAEAEIHRLPSQESTTSAGEVRVVETKATINSTAMADDSAARERRRLMFATRVGSGSQEQIFATQFSISKTESISSHMSEQTQDTLSESTTENLKRQNTVIKKSPEETQKPPAAPPAPPPPPPPPKESKAKAQLEEQREIFHKESYRREETMERQITVRKRSLTTSEEDKVKPVATTQPPVVMRRKTSGGSAAGVTEEKHRYHSRSTSEDDNEVAATTTNHRHSRYLENFDVRKKYHENMQGVQRKPRKQSGGAAEINPPAEKLANQEQYQRKGKPQLPQPPPPSTEPSPLHTPSPSVTEGKISPTSSLHKSEPRSHSQSPVDKARQTPPKPPRTSTPTRRSQTESPPTSKPQTTVTSTVKKHHTHIDRSSVFSTDEPVESSESERDSDMAALESKRRHLALNVGCIEDHESTGLVSQESFDDELPYIPTTLPEEKAQGVNIIPMKERINMEVKTCPLDRPRSTTPLNPSHLEEYIGGMAVNTPDSPFEFAGSVPVRGEKLRISLPRKDSKKDVQSSKSPRRVSNASGKSWFEFAEEGLRVTAAHLERKDSNKQLLQQQQQQLQQKPAAPTPSSAAIPLTKRPTDSGDFKTKTTAASKPPVTTPKASTQRKLSGHWIDFENIPEKRKPPKKITTLPRDSVSSTHNRSTQGKTLPTANCTRTHSSFSQHKHSQQPDVTASTMSSSSAADGCMMPHYNYVKPEDCQCECHESKTKEAQSTTTTETSTTTQAAMTPNQTTPTSNSNNNNNNNKAQGVDLLPKGEDMLPLLSQDSHEGIEPREYSCYTDDELDLPTRSSSRSKSSSSRLDEFPRRDAAHSPRNKKFPDK